ncbi:DUF3788 family protein [Lunatibacter salilacus]|uniref:DUF3788 family protein n=1 Tax=Lunatibacter salilacus TaxID=2483804 RepID=UPI00131E8E76|nr:DUF3788 family protein [Lunatibacter salilacus]
MMNDKKPQQLLGDPNQKPTDKLFRSILDEQVYEIMKKIDQTILAAGLVLEWRYYNDGKAWLGKVTHKKKTVVWLSVWNEFIKAGFYFTEKTRPGVMDLDFGYAIKSSFAVTKPVGKLIPLLVDIEDEERLKDFSLILVYKKNLC